MTNQSRIYNLFSTLSKFSQFIECKDDGIDLVLLSFMSSTRLVLTLITKSSDERRPKSRAYKFCKQFKAGLWLKILVI